MSLRLKLLLLALATLVLPWAGCRYAQEMESALREGEQNSLASVAQTIAASLQGRRDLLFREALRPEEQTSEEQTSDEHASEARPEAGTATPKEAGEATPGVESAPVGAPRGPYDLEPLRLASQPFVDGYADDWPPALGAWRYFTKDQHRFGILTGIYERMLYVLLDVHDSHWIFDAPGGSALDPATFGDRVWIGFDDPTGIEHQVFLSGPGPGSLTGRRIETGEYGQQTAVTEPRIAGAWQASPHGYHLEVRVPLSMLGEHLGVLIDDRSGRGGVPVSYGTLRSDDLHTVGRLVAASPELTTYLTQFLQPGLRLSVAMPDGRLLAQADALAQLSELGPGRGVLARVYRRFVDRPGTRQIIESTAPIYDREHGRIIASLKVSQTEDRWLTLRDRALTRMLNKTVLISLVAVLATLIFAARLAVRLSRLRAASESALTREGLVTTFPETAARDELGDVARGFSTLLGRLNEYTGYLRTLAGKLAHEIRTPLTIVRSSLENLETEQLPASANTYLARAREGSERLNAILLAMGAASRVEEAISSAERTRFDLVPVIASAVESYRIAFPDRQFSLELPQGAVELDGAPDLIVQMLDKLIDNAADFSAAGALIAVRLRLEPGAAVLEVDNPGPPLSRGSAGRLFESLWQSRTGGDSRPHFGLGLYIVRLIAEFHGGEASAMSLPAETGARFSVSLPL